MRRRLRRGHRAGAGRPVTAHRRAGEKTGPGADQGRTKAICARNRSIKTASRPIAFPGGGWSLATDQLKQLRDQSRFQVADGVVEQVGQRLGQPLVLDPATFKNHYDKRLALPYPLLPHLHEKQIARFEELYPGSLGVALDLQPARSYPYGTTAAHLLGYVLRDDSSKEGER